MPSNRQTWRWYQFGKARARFDIDAQQERLQRHQRQRQGEEAGENRPAAKRANSLCMGARHAFFAGLARTP